jgi:hypothetical protein
MKYGMKGLLFSFAFMAEIILNQTASKFVVPNTTTTTAAPATTNSAPASGVATDSASSVDPNLLIDLSPMNISYMA